MNSLKKKPDEIVSDELMCHRKTIFLLDIALQKQISLRKQTGGLFKTKIFINGPISKFCMYVKRHKMAPAMALLNKEGFISPTLNTTLKVELFNPNNFDIW